MTTESDIAREMRESREAAERYRAAMSPAERTIAKAFEMTDEERAGFEAAEAAVEEAERAVDEIGARVVAARTAKGNSVRTEFGIEKNTGRSIFRRLTDATAAKQAAALPGLEMDWGEARDRLGTAIKRRNGVRVQIDAARFARRRAAKQKVHGTASPSKPHLSVFDRAMSGGRDAA